MTLLPRLTDRSTVMRVDPLERGSMENVRRRTMSVVTSSNNRSGSGSQ